MSSLRTIVDVVGICALAVAMLYSSLTWLATLIWHACRRSPQTYTQEPVTVLKPLCGAESGLYENLRSFFVQDHLEYQIVFGVRDPDDPALEVVARLVDEFPASEVTVVVSSFQHGQNCKVSNLINMSVHARHEVLVMSDSDARVGSDYLQAVITPLQNPNVGLVTCIYSESPIGGLWSRLGAMHSNDWYLPSVLLAWLFGHRAFVSGQTICVRQRTLQAIGGLSILADYLAEDYVLGQLIRESGQRVVLADYISRLTRHEPALHTLIAHEVRWMRTLRALKPWGFRFLFLSFSMPLALIGTALAASSHVLATAMLASVIVLRLLQHATSPRGERSAAVSDVWVILVGDILLAYAWCKSLVASQITWRGASYKVGIDGIMRTLHETPLISNEAGNVTQ